jgi:hypothetical protein
MNACNMSPAQAAPSIPLQTMWPIESLGATGWTQLTAPPEKFKIAGEFVDELLVALDVIEAENKQ